MATLNTLVTALKDFTEAHMQLNSFYSGETWDFQAKTNIYPALIATPAPAVIEKGRMVITFNIIVADLCNRDSSNVDEVLSDTLQILGDLYSTMDANEDFGLLETSIVPEPFVETLDDITAGWVTTLSFQIPFLGSICNIPIK